MYLRLVHHDDIRFVPAALNRAIDIDTSSVQASASSCTPPQGSRRIPRCHTGRGPAGLHGQLRNATPFATQYRFIIAIAQIDLLSIHIDTCIDINDIVIVNSILQSSISDIISVPSLAYSNTHSECLLMTVHVTQELPASAFLTPKILNLR